MKEQILKQVTLFASLPPDEVKYLAEILHYREFSAGTVFIQENEIADHFFILIEGQIEVIKALGTQNVFVGSDSGLVGTPNHPDALAMAIKSLRAAGFSEQDLNRMFKETPARLVGLPAL